MPAARLLLLLLLPAVMIDECDWLHGPAWLGEEPTCCRQVLLLALQLGQSSLGLLLLGFPG